MRSKVTLLEKYYTRALARPSSNPFQFFLQYYITYISAHGKWMEVAVTAAWSSCTLESGSNGASAKLGQSASPSAVRPARSHTHIPLMPSCLPQLPIYYYWGKEAVSTITSRSIISSTNKWAQHNKKSFFSYRDGSEMMKRINGTQLKWLTILRNHFWMIEDFL